jgi:hypothetical protein
MQLTSFDNAHSKRHHLVDKEKWLELIKEWEKSNETQTAFCKRHHLDIKKFSSIKTKLLLKENEPNFIPVSIKEEVPVTSTIENIILENSKGIKLYVPVSLSPDQVATLLRIAGWSC